jgi:hypothetical protein
MAPLEDEVKGMPNRTNVKESTGHMGGKQEVFQKFAKDHQNVVVMGFDATVCVEANMFGAPELRSGVVVEQGKKPRSEDFVAPLTTLTNVVTSRAVLVTDATIYSKVDKGQWGCLKGL